MKKEIENTLNKLTIDEIINYLYSSRTDEVFMLNYFTESHIKQHFKEQEKKITKSEVRELLKHLNNISYLSDTIAKVFYEYLIDEFNDMHAFKRFKKDK